MLFWLQGHSWHSKSLQQRQSAHHNRRAVSHCVHDRREHCVRRQRTPLSIDAAALTFSLAPCPTSDTQTIIIPPPRQQSWLAAALLRPSPPLSLHKPWPQQTLSLPRLPGQDPPPHLSCHEIKESVEAAPQSRMALKPPVPASSPRVLSRRLPGAKPSVREPSIVRQQPPLISIVSVRGRSQVRKAM